MNSKAFALLLFLPCASHAYMDFNGSSNYAKIDEAVLSTTPFTISFWYRSAATTSTRAIFTLASTASTTPIIYFARLGASDLSAAPCDVAGRLRLKYRIGGNCDTNICPSKIVNDGSWHFIAARAFNGIDYKVNVDEIEVSATDLDCQGSFAAVDRTAIGARFRAVGDFFDDGDVEDVRVYTRALSDAEVASLSQSRSRLSITDGLVAYWALNDGVDALAAGGTNGALDQSGNEKHMTAVAGPVYWASDNLNRP